MEQNTWHTDLYRVELAVWQGAASSAKEEFRRRTLCPLWSADAPGSEKGAVVVGKVAYSRTVVACTWMLFYVCNVALLPRRGHLESEWRKHHGAVRARYLRLLLEADISVGRHRQQRRGNRSQRGQQLRHSAHCAGLWIRGIFILWNHLVKPATLWSRFFCLQKECSLCSVNGSYNLIESWNHSHLHCNNLAHTVPNNCPSSFNLFFCWCMNDY